MLEGPAVLCIFRSLEWVFYGGMGFGVIPTVTIGTALVFTIATTPTGAAIGMVTGMDLGEINGTTIEDSIRMPQEVIRETSITTGE